MTTREDLVARLQLWVESTRKLVEEVERAIPLIRGEHEDLKVRGPLGKVDGAIQREFNRRFAVAQEVERDSADRDGREPNFAGVRERVLLELGIMGGES